MPAYMIVYARITDAEKFAAYAEAVPKVIADYGGRLIGRTAAPIVLEGASPWQTAGVLAFPSVSAAQTFWKSPEYIAVKALRDGAAEFQVIVTEGYAA